MGTTAGGDGPHMRLVLVESNTTGTGRVFVDRARRFGLEPVLLCADPDRYSYADEVTVVEVDTTDPTVVTEACRAVGDVVGVTTSSEYFVEIAASVAAALGLPGAAVGALRDCRDKGRQRLRLRDAGVPVPGFTLARTDVELADAIAATDVPMVVKPLAGSGSMNVRLCVSADEALRHGRHVLGVDRNERGMPTPTGVLVEQYVDGREFSVEVVDRHVVGVTRTWLGPPPYFVETGHDHPAGLARDEEQLLAGTSVAALDALGLRGIVAHVELRLPGPVVIEVNPRPAGGMIPELVRLAAGVDLIAAHIALAAGLPVDVTPTLRESASVRFTVPEVRHGDFRDRTGHVISHGRHAQGAVEP